MASFLSKFMRGATATGGALFADQAREELRAGIMTERDKVLSENRMSLEKSRQDASTVQHKERLAQQESQYQRGLDTPEAKSAARLEALKVAHHAATTDTERKSIAAQMASEQGKPLETSGTRGADTPAAIQEARILVKLDEFKTIPEALRFLKSKEGNMTSMLFQAYKDKQENEDIYPEDPGYLSVEDMFIKSRETAKTRRNVHKPGQGGGGKVIEHFNTTKNPSVRTQAEFDDIDSGLEYFDVFDGVTYRKP